MSVLPTIRTLRHTSAFFGTYASEPVHLWGKLYWLCRTLVEHYYFHSDSTGEREESESRGSATSGRSRLNEVPLMDRRRFLTHSLALGGGAMLAERGFALSLPSAPNTENSPETNVSEAHFPERFQ